MLGSDDRPEEVVNNMIAATKIRSSASWYRWVLALRDALKDGDERDSERLVFTRLLA